MRKRELYGYVGLSGKVVIPPQFDFADSFFGGMAVISVDGKWGYIRHDGEYAITPGFEEAGRFYEGLAYAEQCGQEFPEEPDCEEPKPYQEEDIVRRGEYRLEVYSRFGYIDMTGSFVIKPKYRSASFFSEGLVFAKRKGPSGYVDRNGTCVVEPRFDGGGSFSEGLAAVQQDRSWFYIDRTGERAIQVVFDYASEFREGRACVRIGREWGFIDKMGNIVMLPKGTRQLSGGFSEGRAEFCINDRFGFINIKGEAVIEPQFDDVSPFKEGLSAVMVGDKWWYIDPSGRKMTPAYDAAGDFSHGLAPVRIEEKSSFIDHRGKPVLEGDFFTAFSFSEGLAVVSVRVNDSTVFHDVARR